MKDIQEQVDEFRKKNKWLVNLELFCKELEQALTLAEQRGREEERKRYKEGFKKLAVERKALMKRISKALKNNSPSEE